MTIRTDPLPALADALLGALLADPSALEKAEALRPEHFPRAAQGRVFEALAERARKGAASAAALLAADLADDPDVAAQGGTGWLTELAARRPRPEAVPELAGRLVTAATLRSLAACPPEPGAAVAALEAAAGDLARLGETARPRFPALRLKDFPVRSGEWLVKEALPLKGVGFLAGPSRGGKSFVALDLALSVASGGSWLGRKTRNGGAIYVGAEDADGIMLRTRAWAQDWAGPEPEFVLIPTAPDLLDPASVRALTRVLVAQAQAMRAAGQTLRLVVIDTLSASLPGADENGSRDMSGALFALARIGEAVDAPVLCVAHTGKNESLGIRGWSGLGCNAVFELIVRRDPDTNARTLVLKKVKNGGDGERIGFTLKTVQLGVDEDGDPITSCVPEYGAVEKGEGRRKRRLTGHPEKVMAAFNRLFDEERAVPAPAAAGVRPGTMAVPLDALRAKAFEIGLFAAEAPSAEADPTAHARFVNSRNRAFRLGLEALERQGLLRTELGFVWDPEGHG